MATKWAGQRQARIAWMSAWLFLCVAGLAAGQSQGAGQPQVDLTTLTLDELGKLEITTVSKEPEQIWQTAAAIDIITQEDIRRSGATTIASALRLAPGVEVAQIDSDHWSIGVRGFGDQFSKAVLVLLDGRSVYTPLFAGINWATQDTLLDDIERIEVIRGPGGTIWGANAVNGVINIITKSAAQTQGVIASIGGGSSDQAMAGFRYGGRGKGVDYRVYSKAFKQGPGFHTDGHNFDEWKTAQAGFRSDWSSHHGDTFVLQGDIYKGVDGQSVSVASLSPPAQTVVYEPADTSGGNVLLRWRRLMSSGSDLQLQASYDHTHTLAPQYGENRSTLDVDFLAHWTMARRHNLLLGTGARVSPSRFLQVIPTLTFDPLRQTDSVYSAFAQDELELIRKRLRVTVGAKLERNNYTGVEVQPGARLLWTPGAQTSFWAAATRAVRTPSRLEEDFQYLGFLAASPLTYLQITGNHDVVSEELTGYEGGYRTALPGRAYLDVSAFHNHHDHLSSLALKIVPPPPYVLLQFPYVNGVKGTSDGFEITPSWQPLTRWQIKGSYSYLHIDLTNRPGDTDKSAVTKYEGSSPAHQVLVQSFINLPAGFQFDTTGRYASALPARVVKAYATADVRLGYQVAPGVSLSISGQNLLQPHHLEFGHDPGPIVAVRRSGYISLSWRR
jgi:iron complex outermembrane receptor protein